jgi:hypothetical protein
MRIGQVNQENYKDFLKILGVKNPKTLEKLGDESENGNGGKTYTSSLLKGGSKTGYISVHDICLDELERRLVASGHYDEGMLVKPGDNGSWRVMVDVSDEAKQQVINKVREMVLSQSSGRYISAEQGDELNALIRQYRLTLPPSERKSATWTLGQIAGAEERRLVDYIASQVPGWQVGQRFDPSILTRSNWGLNSMDIKA